MNGSGQHGAGAASPDSVQTWRRSTRAAAPAACLRGDPCHPPGHGRNGFAVLRSRSGLRCGRARRAAGMRCQAAIGAAITDGDTP